MDVIWIIGGIIGLFLVLEIFLFLRKKKKKIPEKVRNHILSHLQKIQGLSPREQILEYDKILDLCLKYKGYTGTLGEKMKKYGNGFRNTNAIWNAHRLRNKIAHEIDFTPTNSEFIESSSAFRREIEGFFR